MLADDTALWSSAAKLARLTECATQAAAVAGYFDTLGQQMDRLPEPGTQRRGGALTTPAETAQ